MMEAGWFGRVVDIRGDLVDYILPGGETCSAHGDTLRWLTGDEALRWLWERHGLRWETDYTRRGGPCYGRVMRSDSGLVIGRVAPYMTRPHEEDEHGSGWQLYRSGVVVAHGPENGSWGEVRAAVGLLLASCGGDGWDR